MLLGVSTSDTVISDTRFIGNLNFQTDGIYKSLPNTFPVFQPFTRNTFKDGLETIYSVSNSPCLGENVTNGKQLIFWDPPEFSNNLIFGSGSYGGSLDQVLGSPTPYFLTSKLINQILKQNGLSNVEELGQHQPVSISSWELNDGTVRILAGNLEEGINHGNDQTAAITLKLRQQSSDNTLEVTDLWHSERITVANQKLEIRLE